MKMLFQEDSIYGRRNLVSESKFKMADLFLSVLYCIQQWCVRKYKSMIFTKMFKKITFTK